MLANDFNISFVLLLFAGVLFLSGLVIILDGIKRLIAEWHGTSEPEVARDKEHQEMSGTPKRAA